MKKELIIIYHPNPTNDFIIRKIGYYNGKRIGCKIERKNVVDNLYTDEKLDNIRYCFCKKLTKILRKQEQLAEGSGQPSRISRI